MNASIRHSPLSAADVASVARLHQASFPTFFLSQLGVGFLEQFYAAFLADDTAITVVARRPSGTVAGVAVGTTEPDGYFSRLLRRRWLQFGAVSARAAIRRPSTVPRLLRAVRYRGGTAPPAGGALLSSICVLPDARGAGAGLLAAWEAEATTAGASRAYLTTDAIDNDSVNDFYQRNRWVLDTQETTPKGRLMNRYAKELETP
ncbi:hypothetical protein [Occultella kanbiaonis]|uniref:hypothetical protein n=1 Tax=Occultella kanbiaonis TaxID=2675754 RepID=UPI0013D15674|nr:hypothetical protein [Occultella kanbiaonis]